MKTETRAWQPVRGQVRGTGSAGGLNDLRGPRRGGQAGGGGGGGGTKLPAISVTPSSVSFGEQRLGTTSAAKSVTISNTGRANLQFTGITKSGLTPVVPTHHDLCHDPGTGRELHGQRAIQPGRTGTFTANLVITSNASNGRQSRSH